MNTEILFELFDIGIIVAVLEIEKIIKKITNSNSASIDCAVDSSLVAGNKIPYPG